VFSIALYALCVKSDIISSLTSALAVSALARSAMLSFVDVSFRANSAQM